MQYKKVATRSAEVPAIQQDLVDYVDQIFPEKCPTETQTERQIWIMVGTRKVVEFLKERHADQFKK